MSMSQPKTAKRKAAKRKRTRVSRTRSMRVLLQKFPIKQDPSMLPPARRELWDVAIEASPLIRRRA